jgi:hypothetical protein
VSLRLRHKSGRCNIVVKEFSCHHVNRETADYIYFAGPTVYVQPYFNAANYPANLPAIWNSHFGHILANKPLLGPAVVLGPPSFHLNHTSQACILVRISMNGDLAGIGSLDVQANGVARTSIQQAKPMPLGTQHLWPTCSSWVQPTSSTGESCTFGCADHISLCSKEVSAKVPRSVQVLEPHIL